MEKKVNTLYPKCGDRILDRAAAHRSERSRRHHAVLRRQIRRLRSRRSDRRQATALDGYSRGLCGGTHTLSQADIGLFKIKSEGAIAAGVRRIEALCGQAAEDYLKEVEAAEVEAKTAHLEKLETLNQALSNLSADTFTVDADASAEAIKAVSIEAEKALKKAQSAAAVGQANQLLESAHTIESDLKILIAKVDAPDPNALKSMVAHLAGQLGESR